MFINIKFKIFKKLNKKVNFIINWIKEFLDPQLKEANSQYK